MIIYRENFRLKKKMQIVLNERTTSLSYRNKNRPLTELTRFELFSVCLAMEKKAETFCFVAFWVMILNDSERWRKKSLKKCCGKSTTKNNCLHLFPWYKKAFSSKLWLFLMDLKKTCQNKGERGVGCLIKNVFMSLSVF